MAHILDLDLPQERPIGAPAGNYQNIQSSPAMFGGLRADALRELGAGVEKAGLTGLEIATAEQTRQNELHNVEVNSWFADGATELHSQFMNLEGRAAKDRLDEYKKKLSDMRDQAMERVTAPAAQAQLARALVSIQDQYWRYWSGHAASQLNVYDKKVFGDATASSAAQAVNSLLMGDETKWQQNLDDQEVAVRKFYQAQHFPPKAIDAEVMKRRGGTIRTAVDTLVDQGEILPARALLDRYKVGVGIDADSFRHANAKLRSAEARIKGNIVGDEETGRIPHGGAVTAPVANVPASFVGAIKREEGFDAKPRWDVKQWTVGYGTRAAGPDERPDRAELERRFEAEVGRAAKIVDAVNPNLDPGTRAALTSLTFNTGDAWTRAGLGEKIRQGDIEGGKQMFLQYSNVAGAPNAAIAERRYREAQWFGTGEAPTGGPLPDKAAVFDRIVARTADNPLVQTAALARMNQIFAVARTEQTQARAQLQQRMRDTTTEALNTGSVRTPLTEQDFVQGLGLQDGRVAYGAYQEELQLGADMASAAGLDPRERAELMRRYVPQPGEGYEAASKRQEMLHKALARLEKERDADPAAFALLRLPAVAAASDAMRRTDADPQADAAARKAARRNFAAVTLDEQARIGVDPAQRRVVPDDYVDNLLLRLQDPASLQRPDGKPGAPLDVSRMLKAEGALWGEYWPLVSRDLQKKALPLVRVLAAGVTDEAGAILPTLHGMSTQAILKEQSPDSVKLRDLHGEVVKAMAPFKASMLASSEREKTFDDFMGQIEKLAAYYVNSGKASDQAAERAYQQVLGHKYDFVEASVFGSPAGPSGSAFRVPKDLLKEHNITLNEIKLGASMVRAALPGDLQREGKFATAPGDAGLILAFDNRAAVGKDGAPLIWTWADLKRRADEAPAELGGGGMPYP